MPNEGTDTKSRNFKVVTSENWGFFTLFTLAQIEYFVFKTFNTKS